MTTKSNTALLLDRDGVINKLVKRDRLYDSPFCIEDVVLIKDIDVLIKWVNQKNIPVIVVTNQPSIAHGRVRFRDVNRVNRYINKLLDKKGVKIDRFYLCPHHPEGKIAEFTKVCECRKPKPGMLTQAAKDFNLDLTKCFLVGDRDKDIEAGLAVKCKTILYYHEENNQEAIINARKSNPHFKVTSHKEIVEILEKELSF